MNIVTVQAISIACGVFSIACSLHLLIDTGKRRRSAFLLRLAPDSYLFRKSLWDECDGEPMNAESDELMRRENILVNT